MIYMNHNLKSNLLSADGAGDEKMKQDIILSEIAKMIVKCPDRVIMHLQEAGVKFKGHPNRTTLVKAVTSAMHNSPKFAKAMASDIVSGACNGGKLRSADGIPPTALAMSGASKFNCTRAGGVMVMNQGTGQYECKMPGGAMGKATVLSGAKSGYSSGYTADGEKVDWASLLGSIAVITATIGAVAGGKKKKSDPKGANEQKNNVEKDLMDKTNAIGDNGSHIGRNIAIGVAVAIGITGVVWGIYHFSHKH